MNTVHRTKVRIKMLLLCFCLSVGVLGSEHARSDTALAQQTFAPTVLSTAPSVMASDVRFVCFNYSFNKAQPVLTPFASSVDIPTPLQEFREGRIVGPEQIGSYANKDYQLRITIDQRVFPESWKIGEISTVELYVSNVLVIRANCDFSPYLIGGETTLTEDGNATISWSAPAPENNSIRLRLIRQSGEAYLVSWIYRVNERLTQSQVEAWVGSPLPQQTKFIRATSVGQVDMLTNQAVGQEIFAMFQTPATDEAVLAFWKFLTYQTLIERKELPDYGLPSISNNRETPWWSDEAIKERHTFVSANDIRVMGISDNQQGAYTLYVAIVPR